MKKTIIGIIFQLMLFMPCAVAQVKTAPASQLAEFKTQLALVNATFTFPEGVKEVKTPNTEKLPFQYGIKVLNSDCEIWFQANSIKDDWQRFEKEGKQGTNPDSLYLKVATDEAAALSGPGAYVMRSASVYLLNHYNANVGRSFFLNMADLPETNHYQYGLLIVLQSNHRGTLTALCMSNEKGPSFFRNLKKLQDCLRFDN